MAQLATSPDQLTTWEMIASYLEVTAKTAQLWARKSQLPIHHRRKPNGTVFAFKTELDNWKMSGTHQKSTSVPLEDGIELRGWKAVAAHLKVSIRTIQDWENTKAFPVHRLPGKKGRVFAHSEEVNRWKMSINNRQKVRQ